MKNNYKLRLISFFIGLLTIFMEVKVFAVGPLAGSTYRVYKTGVLESQYLWETFLTSSNYDDNLSRQSMNPQGSYLRSYDMNLKFRLSLSGHSSIRWGLNAASVNVDNTLKTQTRSGFNAVWFGADYRFDVGSFDFIVDSEFLYSPYSVNLNQTESVYGDGADSIKVQLIMQKKWGALVSYIYGGYFYRDKGMSDYVPLGIGTQWGISSWILGAEIKGALLAVPDDDYTAIGSKRHTLLKSVNAGSLKFYSTNPEWFTGELDAKFKLTPQFAFIGGAGSVLKARNFSEGTFIYLGLDLQWPAFLEPQGFKADVQNGKNREFIPDSDANHLEKKKQDSNDGE